MQEEAITSSLSRQQAYKYLGLPIHTPLAGAPPSAKGSLLISCVLHRCVVFSTQAHSQSFRSCLLTTHYVPGKCQALGAQKQARKQDRHALEAASQKDE